MELVWACNEQHREYAGPERKINEKVKFMGQTLCQQYTYYQNMLFNHTKYECIAMCIWLKVLINQVGMSDKEV